MGITDFILNSSSEMLPLSSTFHPIRFTLFPLAAMIFQGFYYTIYYGTLPFKFLLFVNLINMAFMFSAQLLIKILS